MSHRPLMAWLFTPINNIRFEQYNTLRVTVKKNPAKVINQFIAFYVGMSAIFLWNFMKRHKLAQCYKIFNVFFSRIIIFVIAHFRIFYYRYFLVKICLCFVIKSSYYLYILWNIYTFIVIIVFQILLFMRKLNRRNLIIY